MRFSVSFRPTPRATERMAVQWEDGRIDGDWFALNRITVMLKLHAGEPFLLSPTGPVHQGDVTENGLAFLVWCQNNLLGVRVTGDIPMLSPVPPHIVA